MFPVATAAWQDARRGPARALGAAMLLAGIVAQCFFVPLDADVS